MSLEIPFKVGKETLYITSCDRSFEISEYRNIKNIKTGEIEPTLMPFKWSGSLDGICQIALTLQVRASDATSFEELRKILKDCTEKITETYSTAVKQAPVRRSSK